MSDPIPDPPILDPDELSRAKAELRLRMARQRQSLAADTTDAANRLAMHLSAAVAPSSGSVVSGYWPMRDEMDPRPCLTSFWSNGCRIALPVVPEDKQGLIFRAWEPDEELVPGPYGTSEPGPEAEIVYPTLLLVPLLAFDRRGRRLGYGGGYYDRTLASLREWQTVQAIGVAYAGQEVEAVPAGAHDALLNGFVTENGFIEISE
ncbi:5-formyltetrahydrofolate cyclo-ligase [Thalassobaculum sp.]|uniref:5-formyltetrahydrofolate cyclo-ligase n=1 Tax=Thalassobaculum sp. TaxID=2022740 RepID=UPI003B59311B